MYVRKKVKKNLAIVLVIALGFVFYRGLKSSTEKDFNCQFKTIYAVCQPKHAGAVMPQLSDIIKEGLKF